MITSGLYFKTEQYITEEREEYKGKPLNDYFMFIFSDKTVHNRRKRRI